MIRMKRCHYLVFYLFNLSLFTSVVLTAIRHVTKRNTYVTWLMVGERGEIEPAI